MSLRRYILFLLSVSALLLTSCSSEKSSKKPALDFSDYISGYTSGIVRSDTEITIHLNVEIPESERSDNLFSFRPSISGTPKWVNSREVIFKPEENLKLERTYQAEFNLAGLLDVPESLRSFHFNFETVQQDLEVTVDQLTPLANKPNQFILNGEVTTADIANFNNVKKTVTAEQEGRTLSVNWEQSDSPVVYTFEVNNIQQKQERSYVTIAWEGAPIKADTKGKKRLMVLPAGEFKVQDMRFEQSGRPYLSISFSEVLDERQNMDGLIRIGNRNVDDPAIRGNKIVVHTGSYNQEKYTVTIDGSVRSSDGTPLGSDFSKEMVFARVKPQVKFTGNKVIVPQAGSRLLIPFRAVGLSGVDVRVRRIYQKNINQFLQVNNLDGQRELHRVGEVIVQTQKKFDSDDEKKLLEWNSYSLDLADLIKPEPGHIYRVDLAFRQHQSVYPCANDETAQARGNPYNQSDYWDQFDSRYYQTSRRNWRERNNPCNPAYYGFRRATNRNVLASNMSIIAKYGNAGELMATVSDLISTKPMSDISISVYNFQQRKLAEKKTNGQGFARFQLQDHPYLLVAEKDDQRGYMKMKGGKALSTSSFNVSGNAVNNNLKGFMYGERGVWRPGDSLFVTLMVEDKTERLPENHPVTFELTNPRCQQTDKKVILNGKNGFYVYKGATEQNDPTGTWELSARLGGTTFQKDLKIETVRPNRLKIELDFEDEKLSGTDAVLAGNLSARWLHGATADDLKADVMMNVQEGREQISTFSHYTFSNLIFEVDTEPEEINAGKLDQQGTTQFQHIMPEPDKSPQILRLNFKTRVYEESGNFSVDRYTKKYYPYSSLVGVYAPEGDKYGRLATDTSHTFRVVSLRADKSPKQNSRISIKLYKLEWQWWWEKSSEKFSNFVEQRSRNVVYDGALETGDNGQAEFDIKVDAKDWGRYLMILEDKDTGANVQKTVRFKWRSRYGPDDSGAGGAPARLTLQTDRETYQPGEKANITFPSFPEGRALVSLETNNNILDYFWVKTEKSIKTVSFDIKPEMAPNIYAHILTVQPHAQKQNDRPMRMYGVYPIMVENPETRLAPEIAMASELKPEEPFSLTVSEKNGHPMTYTVAMVDEGLLDLTGYNTPQPWNQFYAKEAHGVRTWDLYDEVASPYAGSINKILSVGGDGSAEGSRQEAKLVRFKPVVKYAGPFTLPAGASKTHNFTMPHYVGSVKTMVVAGNNGAYGHTAEVTPVRKPLMILASAPRTLSIGENLQLPVSVFNMSDADQEVTVSAETNDLISISENAATSITVPAMSDQLVQIPMSVLKKTGAGTIKVIADNGTDQATYTVDIPVTNPNPEISKISTQLIKPGEQWSKKLTPVGIPGTGRMVLELSTLPPLNIEERLDHLIRYPHGCLEQTTSGVFPQLFLDNLLELDKEQQNEIQKNIAAGIERIQKFQLSDGSFSYWPGRVITNQWSTNYTFHFLTEAKDQGYYIPADLYNNALRYNQQLANNWRYDEARRYSDLYQTYRLYVLALAGEPDMGAMNRLRNREYLSTAGRWRLAGAYALTGQLQTAKEIAQNTNIKVDDYREMSNTFGSSLRDRAMILEVLTLLNDRKTGFELVRELSEALSSGDWLSTQEISYSLMAISKYAAESGDGGRWEATFRFNNQSSTISTQYPVYQKNLLPEGNEESELEIQNTSDQLLHAQVINRGIPAGVDTSSSAYNLDQTVRYLNLNGKPQSLDKLEQGDDVIIEVTVTHPGVRGTYRELALTHAVPSGWEITNSRMDDIAFTEPSSSFEYQDIRDDRILTYFDLQPGRTKTFRVMANASFTGKYLLPTIKTAAMYDASIQATAGGQWITITRPE